MKSEWY